MPSLGHILDGNTVALWRCDEASGALVDASPNGYNIPLATGTCPAATGLISGARNINNAGAFFRQFASGTGEATFRSKFTSAWTLEFWWKRTLGPNAAFQGAICIGQNSVGFPLLVQTGNGSNSGGTGVSATVNNIAVGDVLTILENYWIHFALRYRFSGGVWISELFRNGELMATSTVGAIALPTTIEFCVGGYNAGGNYWRGLLDDIRFSSVARTDAEIGESFTRGKFGSSAPVSYAPPVASVVSPSVGTALAPNDSIVVDVTFDAPERRTVLAMSFAGVGRELVHDGASFGAFYSNGSSVLSITGGRRYTLVRTGGWPNAPSLFVYPIDSTGQEGGA